jgi:serine/threonine protein kinase
MVMSTFGKPIYDFSDNLELLRALYDAIKGHQQLYTKANILHRDISLNNIMIHIHGKHGFLIDLDYAVERNVNREPQSPHRTGTLPFMSINILEKGHEENFAAGYRDDIESFFYVFLWICCTWEKPGNRKRDQPLKSWLGGDLLKIGALKARVMTDEKRFKDDILSNFSSNFEPLKKLALKFRQILFPAHTIYDAVNYDDVKMAFEDAMTVKRVGGMLGRLVPEVEDGEVEGSVEKVEEIVNMMGEMEMSVRWSGQ